MGGLHREIRLGVSRRRVLVHSITAFSASVLVVSCKSSQCVRMCCPSEACPKILTQRTGVRAEFRGASSCPCKPHKKRCCVAHWHFDHPRSTNLVWIGRVATQQWCFRFHATQHHFGRFLSQCSNTGGILQSGSVVYFLSF